LFQFHDVIGPEYIGVSERAVYLALAVAVAAYLTVFWRQLLRLDGILLLLSFGLLGGSVVLDTVLDKMLGALGTWLVLLEDGAKWLGITSWLAFCVVRCRTEVNSVMDSFPRSTSASVRVFP
jgi:hypothetical protein